MRDFAEAPMLVLWELTQACDLACRHCRASSQPERHEAELSTEEPIASCTRSGRWEIPSWYSRVAIR
jgi:MoaA/NifB/PqqE/SkfB family radical SAM enzyme